MKLLLVLTFFSFSILKAQECSLNLKKEDIKLTWTAFKTPLKLGVSGTFKDLGIKDKFFGSNLEKAIQGVNFKINTASVYTKDSGRDAKIVNFFFGELSNKAISGEISEVDEDELTINITMNGVTKEVPFSYTFEDNQLIANGIIDVFDFSLNKSLAALNKACEALHEGKTWNDVALNLEAKFSKVCN